MAHNQFTMRIALQTRGLAIDGYLNVFAASGKGVDSGWDRIRTGLEALGFTLHHDESVDSQASAPPTQEPTPSR